MSFCFFGISKLVPPGPFFVIYFVVFQSTFNKFCLHAVANCDALSESPWCVAREVHCTTTPLYPSISSYFFAMLCKISLTYVKVMVE